MSFESSKLILRVMLAATAVVAGIGVILFFPVSLSSEHTCLLDRAVHAAATASNPEASHEHPSELLRHYLIPYGILWWVSILIVVIVALVWKRVISRRLSAFRISSTEQQIQAGKI